MWDRVRVPKLLPRVDLVKPPPPQKGGDTPKDHPFWPWGPPCVARWHRRAMPKKGARDSAKVLKQKNLRYDALQPVAGLAFEASLAPCRQVNFVVRRTLRAVARAGGRARAPNATTSHAHLPRAQQTSNELERTPQTALQMLLLMLLWGELPTAMTPALAPAR